MLQTKFRGKYEYIIDPKGRVNIPSKFRRAMSPTACETLVITRGTEGSLFIYPLNVWEEFEKVLEKLPLTSQNTLFRSLLLDSISDCALDKQGRIILTPEQIKLAGLDKDVLIVGDIDKIRLWEPKRYNKHLALLGTNFDDSFYSAMASLGEIKNAKQEE